MRQPKSKTLSIMKLESENKRRRTVMAVSAMSVFAGLGVAMLELFVPMIGTAIFITTVVVGFGFMLDSIKKIEANKKSLAYQKALRAIQGSDDEITKENVLFAYRKSLES